MLGGSRSFQIERDRSAHKARSSMSGFLATRLGNSGNTFCRSFLAENGWESLPKLVPSVPCLRVLVLPPDRATEPQTHAFFVTFQRRVGIARPPTPSELQERPGNGLPDVSERKCESPSAATGSAAYAIVADQLVPQCGCWAQYRPEATEGGWTPSRCCRQRLPEVLTADPKT